MSLLIVSINYTEGDQDSYRSVEVVNTEVDNSKPEIFDTGDVEKDWADAMQWIKDNYEDPLVVFSSSCDHFVMDGDKWRMDQNENIIENNIDEQSDFVDDN